MREKQIIRTTKETDINLTLEAERITELAELDFLTIC